MTKLGEWLIGLAVFFAIYFALLSNQINSQIVDDFYFEIQILPVILILLLGLYAATTVLYRTLTFNECKEAADELQKEILEAKADLRKKGMKFE